ncbi:MAG: hypothetical protein NVS9B10_17920 [Nevskia sp.]
MIVLIVLAFALLAGAFWLMRQARDAEIGEELKDRLRVTGVDDGGITPASAAIGNPLVRAICYLFWRTGADVSPATVLRQLLILLLLGVAVAVLRGPLTALIAVVAIVLVVYLVLVSRASRRRIKIIEQMPGYLENVIRVLAAGNTLEESLSQAARESSDPVGPLFISIGRQVRLGAPLDQVLSASSEIYRLRDLKVMALAASINRKYGGSMRGVLKSVITVIRQRASAAQELRALTAETRFSAFTLAFINIGLLAYFYFHNTSYYDQMIKDSTGKYLLFGSGAFLFLGFFFIWRMLKSIDEGDV